MTTQTEAAFTELLEVGPRHPWAHGRAARGRRSQHCSKHTSGCCPSSRWPQRSTSGPTRPDRGSSRSWGRTRSGAATTPTPSTAMRRSIRPAPSACGSIRATLSTCHSPSTAVRTTAAIPPVSWGRSTATRWRRRRRRHSHRHFADAAGRAGRRLDPPRARHGRGHHPGLPGRPAGRASGRLAHRGGRAPETYRQEDAELARRLRAATTWVREQASIVPIPLGTPNAIDPPYPVPATTFGWAAGDAAYAMGPSSWPTRGSRHPGTLAPVRLGTCACGTACSTRTTTTTSA